MERIQQIVPVTDLRLRHVEVFTMLDKGPVVLAQRSRPAAVLVSIEEWDRMADAQAQRCFTKREVEAIVAARLADLRNDPTIAHDDLVKLIMERRTGNATN